MGTILSIKSQERIHTDANASMILTKLTISEVSAREFLFQSIDALPLSLPSLLLCSDLVASN